MTRPTSPIGWERVNPAKREDVIEDLWFDKEAAPMALRLQMNSQQIKSCETSRRQRVFLPLLGGEGRGEDGFPRPSDGRGCRRRVRVTLTNFSLQVPSGGCIPATDAGREFAIH